MKMPGEWHPVVHELTLAIKASEVSGQPSAPVTLSLTPPEPSYGWARGQTYVVDVAKRLLWDLDSGIAWQLRGKDGAHKAVQKVGSKPVFRRGDAVPSAAD